MKYLYWNLEVVTPPPMPLYHIKLNSILCPKLNQEQRDRNTHCSVAATLPERSMSVTATCKIIPVFYHQL